MSRRAVDTLMMMKVKRSEGEDWWEREEKDGRQKLRAIGDPRKRKKKGQLVTPRAVDTLVMMKVKRRDGEDRWEVEVRDGRQAVRQKKTQESKGRAIGNPGGV